MHQNLRYKKSPEIEGTDRQERDKRQAINLNESQPEGIVQVLLIYVFSADALMKNQNKSRRKNTLNESSS